MAKLIDLFRKTKKTKDRVEEVREKLGFDTRDGLIAYGIEIMAYLHNKKEAGHTLYVGIRENGEFKEIEEVDFFSI